MDDRQNDRFAWREHGPADGQAVLFLHGLGGSRTSWEPQLQALGNRGYRAVAWDLPGYGSAPDLAAALSQNAPELDVAHQSSPLPVTFEGLAAAAAMLIADLGYAAHVVGISFGGMIAQYLAALHPSAVKTLTLLATSPKFGLDGTLPDEWRAARLAALDAGMEPGDFADRVLQSLAGPHISSEAFDGQRSAMARITGAALRTSIDCLITHDSRHLLPSITARTLCLVGALDTETPVAYSEALVQAIPNAQLTVIPDVGHLLNAEAPDQVNEFLIERFGRGAR